MAESFISDANSDLIVLMRAYHRLLLLGAIFLADGLSAQESWSTVPSPVTHGLWSVAWGGDQFVAVGEAGTILSSADGVNWTKRESGTTRWLVGVTHARGVFVAVGDAATVLFSYDGMAWNNAETSTPNGLPPERLNVVRSVLDHFVALGENAVGAESRKSPALGWTVSPVPFSPGKWWRGLAFGKGLFVAGGSHGIASAEVLSALASAPIGTTPAVRDIEDVVFARDQFLAVGANGAILTSADGTAWTGISTSVTESLRALAFFNNGYIAVGDGGRIVTSPDGRAWTPRVSPATDTLHAIGGSDGIAIAVGDRGRILRTTATPTVPSILESPAPQTEEEGGNAVLRVRATGAPALSYTWSKNGTIVPGATGDMLLLTNLQFADQGAYTATVTTVAGTATSATAVVAVTPRGSPGIVDDTFQVTPAFTDTPTALLPLGDGRLLVAGGRAGELVRLRSDGTLDPTFQTVQVSAVTCLAVAADGRIFIGGDFSTVNGQVRPKLARLLPDGAVDASFTASATIASATVTDLAVQSDGKLVVANRATSINRLLANGDPDPAFASGTVRANSNLTGDLSLKLVALASDGKILVAGNLSQVPFPVAGVARLNSDGTVDPGFPVQNAGAFPTALRVLADGRIAFASYTFKVGIGFSFGRHLRRYLPSGAVDFSSDLPGLTPTPFGVTLGWSDAFFYPDGRALVSSDFTAVDGQPRDGLARLKPDGSLDATFNPGVTPVEPVTKLAVAADGKIFAAGEFTIFGGRVRPRLVRLNDIPSEGIHAPEAVALSPASTVVKSGQPVTLRATATGSGPLTYRWFRVGRNEPVGVTAEPVFVLNPAPSVGGVFADSGLYYVKVLNTLGEATSTPIALTVVPAELRIIRQPTQLSAQSGRDLMMSIDVNEASTTMYGTYEVRRDGVPVGNAQYGRITFSPVTPATAGVYTVTVHDEGGAQATSAPILVTVDDSSRFINLSIRAQAGAGEKTIIAGFVIDSDPYHARTVLVRGIGPGLVRHGVPNVLADPRIAIYDGEGRLIASNDDWQQGEGATVGQMAAVGAFSLDPGSKDAAIQLILPFAQFGKNFTVHLSSGTSGASGNALLEIYEADNAAHRILNLSARAFVTTDASMTIPGIAIRGPVAKKILVRAVGPSLAPFGVAEFLADPVVSLRDDNGAPIASNNDWGAGTNAAEIAAAASQVGAFPFAANSKDAALLVTVPPGNYTAFVAGAAGTSGIALVEVYEVP